MKSIIKFFSAAAVAVAALLMISPAAAAQDCAKIVDRLCSALDQMTQKMSQSKKSQEVDVFNFDIMTEQSGIQELSDECKGYVLTDDDKSKLNNAFDKFMEVSATKTYELNGGRLTKTQIARELEPLRKDWHNGVEQSTTLGDLADAIADM